MSNETGNKAKLFAKVAKVMAAVRTIPKDGENTFDRYKYIKGDDVFERVGQAMATANLAMLPSIVECVTTPGESGAGKVMFRTVVHGQITLADGETGETWTSDWYGEGADRGDKSINKAMTAMMKYYLLRVFNVGSGEDADEESPEIASSKTVQAPQRANAQRQAPSRPSVAGNGNVSEQVTDAELAINKIIAGWTSPKDAMAWATDGKLTENEHSARTRWAQIVKNDFGDTCNAKNLNDIMRAYAAHYLNKQTEPEKETA